MTADWHPTIDQIADDDAGLTSADDSQAIAEHLAGCSACRETAERLAEVSTLLTEAGATTEPMPTEVVDALDQALATASAERAAERAAGVPSLDERRALRDEPIGEETSASGRRGRWVFGAAAAVAVFAIGAAVANNGLPGSSSSEDSASSTNADAGGRAAAGDKAELKPGASAQTDSSLLAGKPELNADNVEAYARKLAEGKAPPTQGLRTACGTVAEPNDSAVPAGVSSIVSYDGKRAVLRVDPDSRRLTVLSCPGPTRVLYTSSY